MVIYQNVVVWHQEFQNHKGSNFAMQGDFARIAKNFASLAKFYRDSKIGKFRYQQ